MNLLIMLLSLLMLTSCVVDDRRYETKESDRLTKRFAEQMVVYDLQAVGIGGAERNGKRTLFKVVFSTNRVLDKTEARKLITMSANQFLNLLNSHPENYYFAMVPADLSMLQISIFGKPTEIQGNYLSSVSLIQGTIFYNYDNECLEFKKIFNSEEETFEEAMRIIDAERTLSSH